MEATEAPLDLAQRLTTAAASLTEVKTSDFMHKIIVKATQELLLQTAAWIAQKEVDKLFAEVDKHSTEVDS